MEILSNKNDFKTYTVKYNVQAKPMTKSEAIEQGILSNPSFFKDFEEGYCVYNGNFKSWEPYKAFECSHKISDTPLDRMIIEYEEVAERLNTLSMFVSSKKFLNLDPEDRNLLFEQNKIMSEYLKILSTRIERIKCVKN